MSTIDLDTARKMAHLARIRVTPDNLPELARQLSGMVTFMEQLAAVDVTDIAPMAAVHPQRLRLRADVVDDGGYAERLLRNAPAVREGFFAVPKMVE